MSVSNNSFHQPMQQSPPVQSSPVQPSTKRRPLPPLPTKPSSTGRLSNNQDISTPPLPTSIQASSQKASSVLQDAWTEGSFATPRSTPRSLSPSTILSLLPRDSLASRLINAQKHINEAKATAKEFLQQTKQEIENKLQTAKEEIKEKGNLLKETLKNNLPGLDTPEKRAAAKEQIQEAKDQFNAFKEVAHGQLSELEQQSKTAFKLAHREAAGKINEARQAWSEVKDGPQELAEHIQKTVVESSVFKYTKPVVQEIVKSFTNLAPKTDQQKFEALSKQIKNDLVAYNTHIENKQWNKAYKLQTHIEKSDKHLDNLLNDQSKIFGYKDLKTEVDKLRNSDGYTEFRNSTVASGSIENTSSTIGTYNTILAELHNKEDSKLDSKAQEAHRQKFEKDKGLAWESLLQQTEQTGVYLNTLHSTPASQPDMEKIESLQIMLTDAQSRLAGISSPTTPLLSEDYSQRLETVLNKLATVAKNDKADKTSLSQDLAKVETAVSALNVEVTVNQLNQQAATDKLADIQKVLESISDDSAKKISYKSSDPSTFKFIAPTHISTKQNKSHDAEEVVKDVLTKIEQLVDTPIGKTQALQTLQALQKNPVTGAVLEADEFQARFKAIENRTSEATLDQLQSQLFGTADNKFQDQFLLAYRGFIGTAFFKDATEVVPSARLFEWLNTSFNDSNTSANQKAQILELAQKWANDPVLNEGDYSKPDVKKQVDALAASASKSIYPALQRTGKSIQATLQTPHANTALPPEGTQDLSSLINNISSMNDAQRQQVKEQLCQDLSAYTSTLFSNIRPSELINGNWEKKDKPAPNVRELTNYSNQLTYYLRSAIMGQKTPEDALKTTIFLRDLQRSLLDENEATAQNRPVDVESAMAIEIALGGVVDTLIKRMESKGYVKDTDKESLKSPDFLVDQAANYAKLGNFVETRNTPVVPNLSRYLTQIIGSNETQPLTENTNNLNLSKVNVVGNIHGNIFKHQKNVGGQTAPLNTNLHKTLTDFQTDYMDGIGTKKLEDAHYKMRDQLVPR